MDKSPSEGRDLSTVPRFIGEFEIDANTLCVIRDGQSTHLEPRAMSLLLYLARRAGEVVSREELEREIWSGVVVGYDALNNTIAKLRKVLGDDPRNPEYFLTVPKVGYQCIAKVQDSADLISSGISTESYSNEGGLQRKLAAVFCTDVVDYSRLSGLDEEATHLELSACLDLIKHLVQQFDGKVVNFAGDAVLAEFATVSNALSCAVVIQQELAARIESVADDKAMRFRIGLNLGEVIVDRDDIFGDGVIVASRLEGLAEPGGICLSGSVFDAIGNKLPIDYKYLGERQVKNVEKPVRAYYAQIRPGARISRPMAQEASSSQRKSKHFGLGFAASLLFVIFLASWIGWESWHATDTSRKTNGPGASVSASPVVVVLPFENISDDPAQEYFADGMTDDLIADLTKISGLTIISRQSSFAYKDKQLGVEEIAAELGADYVVEGSVKRFGGKIRINANLIDINDSRSLWSERYEQRSDELFQLQNKVIGSIVEVLAVELTDQEKTGLAELPTNNLEAYDYYQRAERRRLSLVDSFQEEFYGNRDSIALYQRAIALDPDFVEAYSGLAMEAIEAWEFGSTQALPSDVARKIAYDAASKAQALDPENPAAWAVLALLQATDDQHEIAITSAKRAIDLDPGNSDTYATYAKVLIFSGEHEAAQASIERAFEINPNPPNFYFGLRGLSEFFNERYSEALVSLETVGKIEHFRHHLLMLYGQLDMKEKAQALFSEILEFTPFANLRHYRTRYKHYKRDEDLERVITALQKAGVPEHPYGYQGNPEYLLGAEEIRRLTVSGPWTGTDHDGHEFVQQISDESKVAFSNPYTMLVGDAWIDDNHFCVRFPGDLLGRDDCGPIYKNPDGNKNDNNEYIRVTLGNVYYFSPD